MGKLWPALTYRLVDVLDWCVPVEPGTLATVKVVGFKPSLFSPLLSVSDTW